MLKWTPKSESDLLEIQDYIASNFTPELAIETVNQLIDFCENILPANPLTGMVLKSNPLFSKLIFEGNSIYYCENPLDKNLYVIYLRARGSKEKLSRLNPSEVA